MAFGGFSGQAPRRWESASPNLRRMKVSSRDTLNPAKGTPENCDPSRTHKSLLHMLDCRVKANKEGDLPNNKPELHQADG